MNQSRDVDVSNSSDAERLLNTIVAARVRLSSLRSGPDISHDARATPLDPASLQANRDEPDRSYASDLASVARSPVHEARPDAYPSPTQTLDSESSIILGIDPIASETSLTIELAPGDEPDLESEGRPNRAPSPAEEGTSEDPFSFIDLIPPEDPFDTDVPLNKDGEQPSVEPPPIRPKPKMPLPLGMAIGAPPRNRSSEPQAVTQSPPTARHQPPPARERPPQSSHGTDVISAELSQPRAVEPRVLDPDRPGLVVDVFENELGETRNPYAAAAPPKLTDGIAIKSLRVQHTDIVRSEDDLFDVITEASACLEHGDIQTAHVLFSDVLDWLPSHLEARLARGRCSRDMGDTVAAYSDFQRAHAHNPLSPGPHLELGNLFFARKDYLRAISHYDDALLIDPHHALTLCRRGICHHHRNRADKALEDLVLARKINPEIPNIDRYIRMVTP